MNARDDSSSPDFLAAPKKAAGVRRLNRLPLLIVAGLLFLAVSGIVYTMWQRQPKNIQPGTEPLDMPVVETTSFVPIQPESEPEPPESMQTQEHESMQSLANQGREGGAMTQEHSAALEQRLRLISRVEEKRLIALEAALGAEAMVSGFGQTRLSNQNANTASGRNIPGLQAPALDIAGLEDLAAAMEGAGGSFGDEMSALGGLMGLGNTDPNRQPEKRAFLADVPPNDVYLEHTRLPALSPTELKAGTIIPGVMVGGINSDLPGQIIGQVRQNIYDTATGQHLLVPAGARLIGTYDSSVTMGQSRVLVAWSRIIFPDGSSVSLDRMPGADVSGYAGFKDKVNNHYWRIFGNAFMLSLFSAGLQLSQPDPKPGVYHDTQSILAAEIGRELGKLGMQISQRNLNIQPTLEIRPGYQFNIMVTKDMVLPPWQGHPLAAGQR